MTTTLHPHQQKILQIAERYNAHPGSTLTIRGVEDVLEFVDEVQGLALEEVETRARPEPPLHLQVRAAFDGITSGMLAHHHHKLLSALNYDSQCDDMAGFPNAR